MNILSGDVVDSDNNSIGDLDYDSDLSTHVDIDSMKNTNQTRKEREMEGADQELYAKSTFITRVEIDRIFSICKLTSFDLLSWNQSKMERGFKGNNTRKDLKSKAIQMVNDHI